MQDVGYCCKMKQMFWVLLFFFWLALAIPIWNFLRPIQCPNKEFKSRPIQEEVIHDTCDSLTKGEKDKLLNGFTDHLHPRLLDLIRCDWINLPSSKPLNLTNPKKVDFSQYKQSVLLDEFMDRMSGKYMIYFIAIMRELLLHLLD